MNSIYPALIDGWDHRSTWNGNSGVSNCYALTRNGNYDDSSPDAWINPPAWPVMPQPETLAQRIAQAAGADPSAGQTVTNDSVHRGGQIHIIGGNRR